MTTMHRPRPAKAPSDAGALRVLVVDHEPSIGELLSLALRYEGWDVCTAATGTAAVELARTFGPDIVLLDRMLPDMDGIDVLRLLRADRPVLRVTSAATSRSWSSTSPTCVASSTPDARR